MKKKVIYSIVVLILTCITGISAQKNSEYVPRGGARLMMEVHGTDTLFLAYIHDIWVFPRNTFKNKAQEQYFWKTVRDVKKALPYSKLIGSELLKTNLKLASLPNDRERKKYMNQFEKEVFTKYEADLRRLSVNQGRLLLKLIDRETDRTSYDLIKIYKGNLSAFFWQGLARMFGTNLKSDYDANDKDKIVERVILLVEAGQL